MDHPQRIGRYVDLVPLGKGGMGIVYRGRDPDLDRPVAIKLMLHLDQSLLERFRREARIVAKLQHAHIVQVYDIGTDDRGNLFYVMELVHGTPLDVVLHRRGALPVAEAIRITRQAADALAVAHRAGVVHRDIKPSNIMLDERGAVKLLDFGIARLTDPGAALTMAAAMIGTPGYMAPEQAQGLSDVDHRADIYSLGLMLWEMLAGTPPYVAQHALGLAVQSLTNPLPDLRPRRQEAPEALVRLVEQMTAKSRDERISRCEAVIKALDAIAADVAEEAGASTMAPPSGGMPRPAATPGTHPASPRALDLGSAATGMAPAIGASSSGLASAATGYAPNYVDSGAATGVAPAAAGSSAPLGFAAASVAAGTAPASGPQPSRADSLSPLSRGGPIPFSSNVTPSPAGDLRPSTPPPAGRSRLPLLAAAGALVLVGGGGIFAVTRAPSKQTPIVAVAPPAPTAPTAPPAIALPPAVVPSPSPGIAPPPAAAGGPIRVAVLPFRNIREDKDIEIDQLARGVAESVVNSMNAIDKKRITFIERNDLGRLYGLLDVERDKDDEKKDRFDPESMELRGKLKGVELTVIGGVQRAGKQARITARIVRISTGEIVESVTVDGDFKDPFALQDALEHRLRERFRRLIADPPVDQPR